MIDEKKLIEEIEKEIDGVIVKDTYSKGKNAGLRKARILAEEQTKIGGWIPCSERLPEKSNLYLVTKHIDETEDNMAMSEVRTEIFWTTDNKWDCERDSYCEWKVIAWQPLPEAYHE